MPRRKYGRMVKGLPSPPPPHKCRACKMGKPCPLHPAGLAGIKVEKKRRNRHSKKSHKVRYEAVDSITRRR